MCEPMTKEEMQRFLIEEAERGTEEVEAYRKLMRILGVEFPQKQKTTEQIMKVAGDAATFLRSICCKKSL